ncbi:Acetyl esterase/lipase [Terriglobus roseus]|uniref:Acetyl esterase/lipase n=2 Tax=Terriglobus roseus TaxID=392734 RepID=A0A1H4R0B1_9BACT|nr:Acetyl esterase/lipase [Terriglobus roseus]
MKLWIPSLLGSLMTASLFAQKISDQPKAPELSVVSAAGLMGPPEFQALPSKPADFRYSYGPNADQFGELRVPSNTGPHPVAILIHGGCWRADYSTLRDLAPMADALKAKGIATWNIEYRRLSQSGGGWPGTYLDVGKGADYLRIIAERHRLDLSRVILVGHSAGGHLAMWAASRSRLAAGSPLHVNDPLPIRGVVNLAGTADMEAFIPFEQDACAESVVEELLGGKPFEVPEHYEQASAIRRLPIGVSQILFWGRKDQVVPMSLGERYINAAKDAGDSVRLIAFPTVGHFEIASPFSVTWPTIESEIALLLQKKP